MKNLTIESAKQFLKDNGYYTDNLWSVHDVQNKYNCNDKEAQIILSDVLQSDRINQEINKAIDIEASIHFPVKSKYFMVSGFWKDDKVKFSDYIIKELDEVDEDEDIDIFYYGISADDLDELIIEKWNSEYEFVITSYKETTLI